MNVAVVGLGYIGEVHIRILSSLPNVRIVGVYDADERRMDAVANKYGIAKRCRAVEEIIEDDTIEVVHNCTPNHLHFGINQKILQSGKHLLSEKPLAITAAESKELYELAKSKGLLTAINFCYRYYPVVQEAKVRVAAGAIGFPRFVKGNFLQDWLLYDTDYNWRLDKKYTGESNTMADIGSHWCDMAQFLTGAKIVSVMADLNTLVPERKAGKAAETFSNTAAADYEIKKIDVDDYGSAFLRFSNGTVGCFTASSLCAGRKVALEIEVYGSEASLIWSHEDPMRLKIGHREKANEVLLEGPQLQAKESAKYASLPSGHPMGYHDAMYNLFSDFYAGVANKQNGADVTADWPDFENGYYIMRIVEALVESSRTKKWVDIL